MGDMASHFDEKAADWDTPERLERAREAARIVRTYVPLTPSMRVIDIGAGTGLLGLELAPDVRSVLLAEPSEGMLEVAQQKLVGAGPTNVTAVAYDLAGEPPGGGPFDLAVSLLVLHHVEDTEKALLAIHALLAPGGRIALMDLDVEDGSFHSEDAKGIHHHGFDQAGLLDVAHAAGFVDVASRNVSEIESDGRSYAVFLLTGRRH
jgi:2-polyprenyl-3-methyl-5-hydroxy-6-metoxy-1,4-benzoquinol methylase